MKNKHEKILDYVSSPEETLDKQPNRVKKDGRRGLKAVLYNDKVIFAFSFILAFVIWLYVAVEKSPEVERTITGVPINVSTEHSVPEQLGLQAFTDGTPDMVDIKIKGRKFVIDQLKATDFTISAQTNLVDSVGYKSLMLKAETTSKLDFSIVSLSKNSINVYFDKFSEVELPLKAKLTTENGGALVAEGLMLGDAVFSNKTVSVSGAKTYINGIKTVFANYMVKEPLSATSTVNPTLSLESTVENKFIKINTGETALTMTLPVLKAVNLPTSVILKNAPTGFINNSSVYSVSPASVNVGIPVENVGKITSLSIGTLDFMEIDENKTQRSFDASQITDVKILDNIKIFKVNTNFGKIVSRTFDIPAENISITAQKEGFTSIITSNGITGVRIVGSEHAISGITEKAITVSLDLSNYSVVEGTQNVPVKIQINGTDSVWAYGKYTVSISSKAG